MSEFPDDDRSSSDLFPRPGSVTGPFPVQGSHAARGSDPVSPRRQAQAARAEQAAREEEAAREQDVRAGRSGPDGLLRRDRSDRGNRRDRNGRADRSDSHDDGGGSGDDGSGDDDGDDAGSGEEPEGPVAATLRLVREVALVLIIALGLSLVIKTFLVQAFFIPSPSMESTLIRGDRVLVSKLTPGPFDLRRGDVVVFADPDNWLQPTTETPEGPLRDGIRNGLTFVGLLPANSDEHLIKRVIGLPGDTVVCCATDGRLTVNGTEINEPYIYSGDDPSDLKFSITVPPGRIWVMGDHRSVSQDSRYHQTEPGGGTVPIGKVVGRAFVKVWPFGRAGFLRNPSSTFSGVPAP